MGKDIHAGKQQRLNTEHAVVIGGSMAGLLAARVLSEHFERVTIIERDPCNDDAEPRKGVPQGRHVHGLLAGGASVLGAYFPDLFARLAQDGAVPLAPTDIRRYQLGVWVAPVPTPVKTLWQSRPFLEQHVRACVAAIDNVHILNECEVTGLKMDNERITGVVVRRRTGEEREDELAASFVVDASGRGTHAPRWLASFGYGQVEESSVKVDIGYASRIYRRPEQLPTGCKVVLVMGPPPDNKRMGVVFPMQGGCWMVTLAGWLRDYPPTDDAGFLEFADSLSQPDVYETIKEAEPVTPIVTYKYNAHRWRHYERMSRLPEGFIVMGDAVCSFNPVYGQGMSVAAVEARMLDTLLREEQNCPENDRSTSFSLRFQRAIAREIKVAWLLSTGEDLRYPEVVGDRPLSRRLFNWYIRRFIRLTPANPLVAATFFQVWHLLKPLKTLFEPRILRAVLELR